MEQPDASIYVTYQHLLRVLMEDALRLVRRLTLRPNQAHKMPLVDRARAFAVLSGIIRRSIIISRYIATLPKTAEEREGRIADVVDVVFRFFALHRIDLATYNASLDAELGGDVDAELEREMVEGGDEEYLPELDVTGRRPVMLVAELCRDFGMAMQGLPESWLGPLSPELRLLCARAAAAAIRPDAPTINLGHLMER